MTVIDSYGGISQEDQVLLLAPSLGGPPIYIERMSGTAKPITPSGLQETPLNHSIIIMNFFVGERSGSKWRKLHGQGCRKDESCDGESGNRKVIRTVLLRR